MLKEDSSKATLSKQRVDTDAARASAAIDAETSSGDISITVDPSDRTEKITARSAQGNIVLNVKPQFAADIDATVVVSDNNANTIQSDFPGLTIRREQVNGKTFIRATGKINGGGERVELYAGAGTIHIASQIMAPIRVATPR